MQQQPNFAGINFIEVPGLKGMYMLSPYAQVRKDVETLTVMRMKQEHDKLIAALCGPYGRIMA